MPRFPHKQRVFSPSPVLSRLIPSFSNTLSPYKKNAALLGPLAVALVVLLYVASFFLTLHFYKKMEF